MFPLKQSTASQEIPLGPFVDDTDGKTAETGLTIANTDIKIWKSGGTTEASKNSGGATHIASGRYYAVLDATDTDTLGPLRVSTHVSGALPVWLDCIVYAANVYDSLFGGSDKLQVHTDEITADLITAAVIADNAIDAGSIASNAITAAKIASDAITAAKVAADVTTEIQSGLATAAALSTVEGKIDTIDDFVDTEVAAIKAKTDQLTFTTANQLDSRVLTNSDKTGYGLSSAAVQAIWDALTSALTTVGSIGKLLVDNINATISSRLASASYTVPPTAAAVADQVWEETLADHSGTSGSTAAALNAAGSAGDPWNTALPGAYGAGSAGKIIGDNLNATVSSRASQTSVDTVDDFLDTEIAAIKAKTDNLPASPAAVGSAMTLTSGERDSVADALLDRSNGIETSWTLRKAMRIVLSALGGKLSGAATSSVSVRNVTDSKARISATVDSDGNRTAVTLDGD